jgi:hypothetical protein
LCDQHGDWLADRIDPVNLAESRKIWGLVDQSYEPIDWQRDFKSGYRWSESQWYLDVEIPGDAPGSDIKVPWELARCQHLPQLALFYASFATKPDRVALVHEFRNQTLDFIANNPPGYGVNWRCTMDVAIRVANWLLAWDIFSASGAVFDHEFESIFRRSILEHGRHIVANVEWTESGRSNHYLSNVVGLLMVATYLPSSKETDAWAGWALRELVLEIRTQFDTKGANCEGSTSYHRLSAEMVFYGCAYANRLLEDRPNCVAAGIDKVPGLCGWGGRPRRILLDLVSVLSQVGLPEDVWDKLEGMARFAAALTKPDGTLPQIGDNDSGRFIKLGARYLYRSIDKLPVETFLDHTHLQNTASAFFEYWRGEPLSVEAAVLRSVSGIKPRTLKAADDSCRIHGDFRTLLTKYESVHQDFRQYYEFELPKNFTGDVVAEGFNDFGVFIWRSESFFAAFRCGPAERYGEGGHLHHDQLCLELMIDGINRIRDPGSYVYTPIPNLRNSYRGLKAHFTPWPADESLIPADEGLFAFPRVYRAKCLHFSSDAMAGMHWGFGQPVYRVVTIEGCKIVVRDFSEEITIKPCPFIGDPSCFDSLSFSDGYGRREKSAR